MRSRLLSSSLATWACIVGCGGGAEVCPPLTYTVSPASATVNHASAAPANTQQFTLQPSKMLPGCAYPALLRSPQWTVSDTKDVAITADGLATCHAKTSGPITVTAEAYGVSGNLTCE